MLTYNCQDCDAPCCRGNGIGIGRSRELVTLASVQKKLPLFATPGFSGSAMLSLSAPKEGCWFLDKKARCRLETVIGRQAKPAGCRLFPFQRLRQMGNAVTVMPDFVCPLSVADSPDETGPFSHDELVIEMHRTHIPARGHQPLPAPADMTWDVAQKLERRVVRKSEKHLNDKSYVPFAQRQLRLIEGRKDDDRDLAQLETLERDLRSFLDVAGPSRRENVHDMVALTGVLRLMTSGLPRRSMPSLLLATTILLDAYDTMKGTRHSSRTPVSLFEQRLPFLFVLSHLLDKPMLVENVDPKRLISTFPAVRAPLLSVLEAVVENRAVARPKTTLQILEDQKRTFRPPLTFEAVAMLYGLGRILLSHGQFVAGRARAPQS